MIDPKSLTKLYYTIGEVAEMFDVSTSLVRYWETEFKAFKPKKDRRGDRRYVKKDILLFEQIHNLVKTRGFTLEGARMELNKPSETESKDQIISRLQNVKRSILKLKDELD